MEVNVSPRQDTGLRGAIVQLNAFRFNPADSMGSSPGRERLSKKSGLFLLNVKRGFDSGLKQGCSCSTFMQPRQCLCRLLVRVPQALK